jgi:hypothetical protein
MSAQETLSRVTVEFFGLVVGQNVSSGSLPQTRIHLLKGAKTAHLGCLAILASDLAEDVVGYANDPIPRGATVVGSDVCVFLLNDYQLTLEGEPGKQHNLGGLVSLKKAYELGKGSEPYELSSGSSQISATVTLVGGSIVTRADAPLDTRRVVFNSVEGVKLSRFADNTIIWRGEMPLTLTLNRPGSPEQTPWTIKLKGSARVFIYSLPASGKAAETDLKDFESIYELLVAPPPERLVPTLESFGYDDFPRCIPPPEI